MLTKYPKKLLCQWLVRTIFFSGVFLVTSVSAQSVLIGMKATSILGGRIVQPHQLVSYDLQTGKVATFFSASFGENFDAVTFAVDGSLFFSGRTIVTVADNTFTPSEIGRYSWLEFGSESYFSAPNDVAAIHVVDDHSFLIAFKVATQFGGLEYSVGDVFLHDRVSGVSTRIFSAELFYTVEEGGSYPVGNIDSLAMTTNGNLLLSTTNTAEISQSTQEVFKIRQSGVYEYDLASGMVSVFIDPDLINGSGVDIKAFALLPDPLPDVDGDGTSDFVDQCQATPMGSQVNSAGCAAFESDTDGDGVTDDIDQCTSSPQGEAVDLVGCAYSELDDDGDGVNNGRDYCADSPPDELVNVIGCPKSAIAIPALPLFGFMLLAFLLSCAAKVNGRKSNKKYDL